MRGRRLLSHVGHEAYFGGFHEWWEVVDSMAYASHDALLAYQDSRLRMLVRFAYKHVPYYRSLFASLGLSPQDIRGVHDLPALPVLTKNDLEEHWSDFLPQGTHRGRYVTNSTGGSTGRPLVYRMSREDFVLSQVIRHHAYSSAAGYRLGDRMVVLGGSSVLPSRRSRLKQRIIDCVRHEHSYSSFSLSERKFQEIREVLERPGACYMRGYPSSIYLFACSLLDAGATLRRVPRAVFTTAEMLLPSHRDTIESALQTAVFDHYGLNDGGVSACECENHAGLHVDMVRSVLEVVDDSGKPVGPGVTGHVLATSLYNRAMPFVRYDTGDLAVLEEGECGCGRHTPRLRSIVGRTGDCLVFRNGRIIAPPILTILFGKYPIRQYQVVQKAPDSLEINLATSKGFTMAHEERIRKAFAAHLGQIDIRFNYLSSPQLSNSKWKFIVSEIEGTDTGLNESKTNTDTMPGRDSDATGCEGR
jgi:phenylacetate-CoA ligase